MSVEGFTQSIEITKALQEKLQNLYIESVTDRLWLWIFLQIVLKNKVLHIIIRRRNISPVGVLNNPKKDEQQTDPNLFFFSLLAQRPAAAAAVN